MCRIGGEPVKLLEGVLKTLEQVVEDRSKLSELIAWIGNAQALAQVCSTNPLGADCHLF